MTVAHPEPGQPLELEGRLTIETADALCVQLREFLENEQTPALDLSRVTECDTASLQVIYSAFLTAAKSSLVLRLHAVSVPVSDVVRELGLHREPLFSGVMASAL